MIKVHRVKTFGISHSEQIKRKLINKTAIERQRKRQHATNSRPWLAIREQHIQAHQDNHYCANCLNKKIKKLMTDVDHIDGDTFNNNPDNLQSLCKSCHSRKTAVEDGGFGHKKL